MLILFLFYAMLQFDYYQLPFCEPRKIHDLPENLGEVFPPAYAFFSPSPAMYLH